MTRALAWLAALALLRCGGAIAPDPIAGAPLDASADVHPPHVDASTPDVAVVDALVADVVAPFSPASIGNLALWLDASASVNVTSGHVIGWSDQSAHKNDAAASSAYAPTFAPSAVHGRAAIHFDKASAAYMLVGDAPSLQFGTGDYVLAFVAQFTNDPKDGYTLGAPSFFFKSTYANGAGAGLAVWGNVPTSNGTVQSGFLVLEDNSNHLVNGSAYDDGVARLLVVRRVANVVSLRVGGVAMMSITETAPVDVSAAGQPVIIGALAQTYYRIIGDVAEIVAVKGATSDSDVTALEAYFAKKYAL